MAFFWLAPVIASVLIFQNASGMESWPDDQKNEGSFRSSFAQIENSGKETQRRNLNIIQAFEPQIDNKRIEKKSNEDEFSESSGVHLDGIAFPVMNSESNDQGMDSDCRKLKSERTAFSGENRKPRELGCHLGGEQLRFEALFEFKKNDYLKKLKTGNVLDYDSYFYDLVTFRWISELAKQDNVVVLAFGNPEHDLSDSLKSDLRRLVTVLNARHFNIIYDADAKSAPVIESCDEPQLRVGVSGTRNQKTGVVGIENSYLRMNALGHTNTLIFTPDSWLGLGLLIEYSGKRTLKKIIYDPSGLWVNGLGQWSSQFETLAGEISCDPSDSFIDDFFPKNGNENLGIHYDLNNSSIQISCHLGELYLNLGKPSRLQNALCFDYFSILERMSSRDFSGNLQKSRNYSKSLKLLQDHIPTQERILRGAVLFGSSRGNSVYEPKVRSAVKFLAEAGFPMVTGGSGGFMELANRIAFDQNVPSVGIHLFRSSLLISEFFMTRESQTLSLGVSGYEERIPLLLKDRSLVLVAPGGDGTMKELATTFVAMAGGSENSPQILFISKAYYQKLVDWIHSLDPSSSLVNQVKLVDSWDEMKEVLEGDLKDL